MHLSLSLLVQEGQHQFTVVVFAFLAHISTDRMAIFLVVFIFDFGQVILEHDIINMSDHASSFKMSEWLVL